MRARLPATVVALGLTSLFTDIGSEMIFPLLPAFLAELGGGMVLLGFVEGAADAVASELKLAAGYLADRGVSKTRMVVFGYALAAFIRPLMGLATTPYHVLAVRTTDRVGKGLRAAPRDALLAASVPADQTGHAFGFHRAMDHLGATIGPLVATGLLAFGVSVRTIFLVTLAPGLVALACALVVREPAPASSVPERGRAPKDVLGTKPSALTPRFRRYLSVLALFALGNSTDAFLLVRARELGVAVTWLPILWTVLHASKVGSAYVLGRRSDRVVRHTMIAQGWCVCAMVYCAFAFATQTWHAWVLFAVYGIYYGFTEPTERALVRELTDESTRARGFGWYNFIVGASAIPAGVFTGWLWSHFGSKVALLAGAAIALLSLVALAAWARAAPRAECVP